MTDKKWREVFITQQIKSDLYCTVLENYHEFVGYQTLHFIEYSAYQDLQKKIEIALKALKKAHGALGYAYDDHADMFYLNSQDDINQCIKEIVGQ